MTCWVFFFLFLSGASTMYIKTRLLFAWCHIERESLVNRYAMQYIYIYTRSNSNNSRVCAHRESCVVRPNADLTYYKVTIARGCVLWSLASLNFLFFIIIAYHIYNITQFSTSRSISIASKYLTYDDSIFFAAWKFYILIFLFLFLKVNKNWKCDW